MAGVSAYHALMGLMPVEVKPVVLTLNIAVSSRWDFSAVADAFHRAPEKSPAAVSGSFILVNSPAGSGGVGSQRWRDSLDDLATYACCDEWWRMGLGVGWQVGANDLVGACVCCGLIDRSCKVCHNLTGKLSPR